MSPVIVKTLLVREAVLQRLTAMAMYWSAPEGSPFVSVDDLLALAPKGWDVTATDIVACVRGLIERGIIEVEAPGGATELERCRFRVDEVWILKEAMVMQDTTLAATLARVYQR